MGDAWVVFDPKSWETHVLPPVASVFAELIMELCERNSISDMAIRHAIRDELELDPDSPNVTELLRMLREIGLLYG